MKRTLKFFEILILMCGVFYAETDEVKTVMEGDSVTLNPDLTQIQGIVQILWRFGEKGLTIARFVENRISFDEKFKERLQLNQTGYLTIKNMRIKHSGLYKLKIDHNNGTSNQKFSVTVYESPSGIDAGEAERQPMPVTEGDPVTLHVPQIQGDELIVWRFGDEGKLIAKADIENKSSPLYYDEERFRDRLQLNNQTGSLTITNTRITDSGFYKAKISSNKQTSYKRFTVTVFAVPVPDPGLSGGAVAGIVVGVLLAAVVAFVINYLRPRTLPSQTLPVQQLKSVTLNPETEIQTGDEIQWLFGDEDTLIAEIKGENREMTTHEGPDGMFRDRLKLDEMTGSLIITDTRTEHAGLYTLKIRRGKKVFKKKFHVYVVVPVQQLKSVTLKPGTEIQTGDVIQWLFGDKDTLIAEIKGETREMTPYEGPDGMFRDRLKQGEMTGSLIITDTRTEHDGLYTLKIRRGRRTFYQRFYVYVVERIIRVMEGNPVKLNRDPEIQTGDVIQWLFGYKDTLIAEIIEENREMNTHDGPNERFKNRLYLDEKTGSLIITDARTEHTGLYTLKIRGDRETLKKRFLVSVRERIIRALEGDLVTLHPDPEIQTGDEIQWLFGDEDTLIAEIKGENREMTTHEGPDGMFRDRLKRDETTGSLIITDTRTEHTGRYTLKIRRGRETFYQKFHIFVKKRTIRVMEGKPVTLNPDPEIQRGDEIQWLFGDEDTLIAEIKGENREMTTHEGPDGMFRDRLKLDEMTGSLIITDTRTEHDGLYTLKIRRGRRTFYQRFHVYVRVRFVRVAAGESVRLNTGLTEIQRDDEIEWRFGKENSLIAEIKGGTGVTHDVPDKRFRYRLELNEKTGSLTVKNSIAQHAGPYKLKIRSSEGTTNMTFIVNVKPRTESLMKEKTDSRENRGNESATVEMPLLNREDVNVVNEKEGTSSL